MRLRGRVLGPPRPLVSVVLGPDPSGWGELRESVAIYQEAARLAAETMDPEVRAGASVGLTIGVAYTGPSGMD